MSKLILKSALATLAVLGAITVIDTPSAEARRGGGGGFGFGHGGSQPCFRYYDTSYRWCGVRNGRQGCFVGGYRVMCR